MADLKSAILSKLINSRVFKRKAKFYRRIAPSEASPNLQDNESEIKGRQFEEYVVRLFNPDYFTLLEWRSDKRVNDIYPITSHFPDLEFYYKSETQEMHFAVECKWRQNFYRGSLDWLKERQLSIYKEFSSELEIPVFLVIGVGGQSNSPNVMYIIPVNEIDSTVLHEMSISPFIRRSPTENFYLNVTKKILT